MATKADAMKERRDIDGLIEQLSDRKGLYTYDEMRAQAARALQELGLQEWGRERAIKALIDALDDPESLVRCVAARCLGEMGDISAVDPLIAALDGESVSGGAAAEALGSLGETRSVEPLMAAFANGDEWLRKGALRGLSDLDDTRVVELLISALQDPHEDVREEAAFSLQFKGDARAIEPLRAVTSDSSERVRKYAAEALDRLGEEA